MTTKVISLVSRGFILFSAFSLGYVAILALINPQSVMDLVGVKLSTTDSISSIRGVYGGVGISLVLLLVYLAFYQTSKGLVFLSIFWGSYAVSRIITLLADGPLGEFGNTWLLIESFFCMIGIVLLTFRKKFKSQS